MPRSDASVSRRNLPASAEKRGNDTTGSLDKACFSLSCLAGGGAAPQTAAGVRPSAGRPSVYGTANREAAAAAAASAAATGGRRFGGSVSGRPAAPPNDLRCSGDPPPPPLPPSPTDDDHLDDHCDSSFSEWPLTPSSSLSLSPNLTILLGHSAKLGCFDNIPSVHFRVYRFFFACC